MKDLITRAMTKDGLVNAVAISSTGIVERASLTGRRFRGRSCCRCSADLQHDTQNLRFLRTQFMKNVTCTFPEI